MKAELMKFRHILRPWDKLKYQRNKMFILLSVSNSDNMRNNKFKGKCKHNTTQSRKYL